MTDVVYIPAYNSNSPNYMYEETLQYPNPSTPPVPLFLEEHLFDVVVTDNYFAVVGCRKPADYTLAIRKMPIGAPDLSNFASIYTYPITAGPAFIDYLCGISLEQDYIAVSSIYLPPTVQNSEAYTLVCTIDLNTYNTNMTHAQSFKIPQKADPVNMTYLRQHQKLVLTEPMLLIGNYDVSCFVYLDPFSTANYTVPVYYKDVVDSRYSLTNVGDHILVASAGMNWFYLEHSLLNLPAFCIKYFTKEVGMESIVQPASDGYGVGNFYSSQIDSEPSQVVLRSLNNTCIEQ